VDERIEQRKRDGLLPSFLLCAVPFLDGTPEYSWLMDPSHYNDADKLLAYLHEMNVRCIVKSPNYPKAACASIFYFRAGRQTCAARVNLCGDS
jgi:hypothetical protein